VTESNEPEPQQQRSRLGEWAYKIFGPAQVNNAIQGHSPEARDSWKRRVAARKAEQARKRSEGR
jgi:hypothetical protein